MTVVRLSLKRSFRPLPLSCVLHGVVLLGLGLFMSFQPEWQTEIPMAEVEMAVSPEELPERHVPQAGSMNPFAENSVWKPSAEKSPSNTTANQPAGGDSDAVMMPPAASAAANGDGAPEGSTGSSDTGSGMDGGGGKAGESGAGAGASDSTLGSEASGAGNEPSESLASIASRFAARVEGNKEYPYMAVKRGQTGVVRVTVTISADGNLTSAYVSSSAGSLLDNAAMQAVQQSCPFSHGAGKSITLTVPIHFDLEG